MFQLPAVSWARGIIAVVTFVMSYLLTTISSFFSVPPYNYSTQTIKMMFFALLIGNILGAVIGGPMADMLVLKLTTRNGGTFKPEFRL